MPRESGEAKRRWGGTLGSDVGGISTTYVTYARTNRRKPRAGGGASEVAARERARSLSGGKRRTVTAMRSVASFSLRGRRGVGGGGAGT